MVVYILTFELVNRALYTNSGETFNVEWATRNAGEAFDVVVN